MRIVAGRMTSTSRLLSAAALVSAMVWVAACSDDGGDAAPSRADGDVEEVAEDDEPADDDESEASDVESVELVTVQSETGCTTSGSLSGGGLPDSAFVWEEDSELVKYLADASVFNDGSRSGRVEIRLPDENGEALPVGLTVVASDDTEPDPGDPAQKVTATIWEGVGDSLDFAASADAVSTFEIEDAAGGGLDLRVEAVLDELVSDRDRVYADFTEADAERLVDEFPDAFVPTGPLQLELSLACESTR